MMTQRAWHATVVILAFCLVDPTTVQAKPIHKQALADYFGPYLAKKLKDCRTCHVPNTTGQADEELDEKPHNAFGRRLAEVKYELRKAGKKFDIPARIEAVAVEDSDGDGVGNLLELLSGHFPGDPNDKPSAGELAAARRTLAAFRKYRQAAAWNPLEVVRRPPVPRVQNRGWIRNPIDAFLATEHEKQGLRPRPEAARTRLLRRVYLDLIGLPPTRAELRVFLTDPSPDAYEKVVDRLLASPRHGERWARHWMDVWRYSDWAGYGAEVRDSRKHIWHWRDWIVESVNRDQGYDRMVMEMLAADEMDPTNVDALRATGFLARNWYLFNRNVWLENTVEHTGKAFLGITLNCARCHDHFFDPISQKEYFAFRAFFEPLDIRNERVRGQPDINQDSIARAYDARLDAPTYLFVRGNEANPDKSAAIAPGVPASLAGSSLRVEAVTLPGPAWNPDKRDFVIRETLAASAAAVALARAKLLGAEKEVGYRFQTVMIADVEERNAHLRLHVPAGSPFDQHAVDSVILAAAKYAHAWQRAKIEVEKARLAASELRIAEARHAALTAVLAVERLEDVAARRVNPEAWKKAATAAALAQRRQALAEARHNHLKAQSALRAAQAAADQAAKAAAGRKADKNLRAAAQKAAAELAGARSQLTAAAGALTLAEKNAKLPPTTTYTKRPLTTYPPTSTGRRLALARWIADPRNPLTARVAVNHIWMRHFGKPLVPTVFDFGKNGRPPTHPALLDWLADELVRGRWGMKRLHRLMVTSAAYRMDSGGDSSNAAADPDNRWVWQMNPRRMEAEVVRDSVLYVAGNLDQTSGGPDLAHELGLTSRRRSLYFQHAAEKQMEFLSLFDVANVTECYRRTESIIPQQALALANSSLVLAQSRLLARRLSKEIGPNPTSDADFVQTGFEHVLGRVPTPKEQSACRQFLRRQRQLLADRSKLTSFDAGVPCGVPPAADPHLRARENLIHVLLNHNEFVTIR